MGEKNLNFDEIINRYGTNCLKYDFALQRGQSEDVLPLWVADMDFKISSFVQEALIKQAEHGIYGYTDTKEEYFSAVYNWVKNHYKYEIKEQEIIKTPGVVFAIAMAIMAYTKEGESVLIQQPVYYPFSGVIRDNKRKIVSNDLVYNKDELKYSIDFDDFEKKIKEENVKLFILCNPHNPVGRAWNEDELIKLYDICRKNNVIIFSDEIHADFVWEKKHISLYNIDGAQNISIVATSPSKTFNLAGLQISNIFIKNDELRAKFQNSVDASGYSQLNAAGIIAGEAAYKYGEEWYRAVLSYIKANIDFMDQYLKENLPSLKMIKPEATYLTWVDCSALGLSDKELEDFISKKAKLWLDGGFIFGKSGSGFQRFNTACPRDTLEKALDQLKEAVQNLK